MALLGVHREGPVQGVGLVLDVERVHRDGKGAELLVHPGVLRQHEHAVAAVHQAALLGHQVHPVEDRVDDEGVEQLVGGHRLREVVVEAQVDRLPVGGAVFEVHVGGEPPDLVHVLDVLVDVLPAGHQEGEECHPLGQLRVVLEHGVERLEAPQHVLRQVGAVDPQDEELAPLPLELLLDGPDLG